MSQGPDKLPGPLSGSEEPALESETEGLDANVRDGMPHFVVGIGASAGGLDAIERFFDYVPLDTGMSFVVIQHLSPDFKSLMDELLARHTELPIHRVENGMPIQRDAVYLIPPKKNMVLNEGKLWLNDQDHKAVPNLPIDVFFRSLARDAGERAIAVILSGTGSDGSRGVRDVHEGGGLVVVQDPETTVFDGMPRTAIASGTAHFVLPPESMPKKILRFANHPSTSAMEEDSEELAANDDMTLLFGLLRRQFGVDFTLYKPGTIARRLERRMNLNSLTSLQDYLPYLEQHPEEFESLYRDLLVEVTQFFRDPKAFGLIRSDVVPRLFEQADRDEGIRVWVPGCATGEEAYSLAILLHSYRESSKLPIDVKIFATDVHRTSLDIAASGEYSEQSVADLPAGHLARYFIRKRNKYVVSPELRQLVLFAPQNLTKDPPFTKLDLISCRNLLIYLNPQSQRKIMNLFQFGLKIGGYLMLGPSESLADTENDFEVIDSHWKIFRKKRDLRTGTPDRLGIFQPISSTTHQVTQRLAGAIMPRSELSVPTAYEALLGKFVPPGLLVDEQHQLLHVFGDASKYLKMPEGRATNDVFRMFDDDLRIAVSSALHRAAKERVEVAYSGIRYLAGAQERRLRTSVVPLTTGAGKSLLYLIRLEEEMVPTAPRAEAESFDAQGEAVGRIHELEQELVYTKEHLQTTIEELETSNEELQSTNEELVASNEELQSTNEELHSVNEELYTVNAEYQKKIEELTLLTNDMDNLLSCTDIGTIFLDTELSIRKFTPAIASVFNMLPQDVGRPLKHISINLKLEHDALVELISQMLTTGKLIEREVVGPRGQTFLMRILPYRIQKGVTEGSVLTFIDVSALKDTQTRLERDERRLSMALDAGEICTWEWNVPADRFNGDERFKRFFQLNDDKFGESLQAFLDLACEEDRAALRESIFSSLGKANRFESEFKTCGSGEEMRYVVVRADVDRDTTGRPLRLFGVCIDVTSRRKMTDALQESQDLLKAVLDNSSAIIFAKDKEGRYLFVNQPIPTRHGMLKDEVLGKTDRDLFTEEAASRYRGNDLKILGQGEVIQLEENRISPEGVQNLLTTKFPLRDKEGSIRGVGGISTDITRLKEAESEVRNALVRRDSFLAMLSHELRNPLGTILNATYVLQERESTEEEREESVQILQRQGEQMSRLLDDLLDVARLTQNKIQIKVEPINLIDVIAEAILVCKPEAERSRLRLESKHRSGSLPMLGDSVRLQQVMVNLVKNALKYTPSGGVVEVSSRRQGNLAEIRVEDSGIGLAPEMLERVFDLFVQADPGIDRSDGGMGVGLTLARTIIERHGGRIKACSDGVGKGSQFVLELPLREEGDEAQKQPLRTIIEDWPAKLHVVIVEDNDDSRRMLETLLSLEGCEVTSTSTGIEGLEAIVKQRPSLALIDIGLPVMSGYDVARKVRSAPGGGDIRLIALTGYGRAEDHQRVVEAGFDEHLIKPLRREALMQVLNESRRASD